VEGRVHQLALLAPGFSAGIYHQAVAERDAADPEEKGVLVVILMIFNQDMVHVVRMADQHHRKDREAEPVYIAFCLLYFLHELELVPVDRQLANYILEW
jgi:hypothetical protein